MLSTSSINLAIYVPTQEALEETNDTKALQKYENFKKHLGDLTDKNKVTTDRVLGTGQFSSSEDSTPTIGNPGEDANASEELIQISFLRNNLPAVINSLEHHPYETFCAISSETDKNSEEWKTAVGAEPADPNQKNVAYALILYARPENCEQIKEALFNVGAGVIGKYKNCAWNSEVLKESLPSSLQGSPPEGVDITGMQRMDIVCDPEQIDPINKILNDLKTSDQLAWYKTWPFLTFPYLKKVAEHMPSNLA